MRDYKSTSYVGTRESVENFAPLLREEANRRGIGKALMVVFIGDGAAWIWELARTHFPLAILILDFYHICALMGNRWDECWDQINNSHQFATRIAA